MLLQHNQSNDKLKIAILSKVAGGVYRGVETVCYELSRRLPYETKVFSLYESDWTVKIDGITREKYIHRFYSWLFDHFKLRMYEHLLPKNIHFFNRYAIEEVTFGRGLSTALDKFKPDIILNHSGPIIGRYCSKYRKRTGVPFVVAGGAGIGMTEAKNVYTRPDAYIAKNPESFRFIKSLDAKIDVTLIPNGVDLEKFNPEGSAFSDDEICSIAGYTFTIERPIVLSTSAIERMKRLHLAIDAMHILGKGTLVISGDGQLKDYIISYGKKKLGDRFMYIGCLDYKDIQKLYRWADVYVMPSMGEPFGNVALEAMASGLPVVATDDECRKWVVGEKGGILVDVENVRLFAEAIEKAYSRNMGDYSRLQSMEFSWDRTVEKYCEVFNRVIGRHYGLL